jgi:acyl-coenzyme A thioesterase PaaI-like protein
MKKQPNSRRCFVCGVENVGGVRVAFYDTTDGAGRPEVLARFTPRSEHQGYPGRLHGGVAAGVLDETIGRAINAGAEAAAATTWGVAIRLSLRYLRPVPLDVELTARGRIHRNARKLFEGTGEIVLPDGTVAVRAEGQYIKLPLAEITAADPEALGWRVYDDRSLEPAGGPTGGPDLRGADDAETS